MLATAFPLVGERGGAASDWIFDLTARTKLGDQEPRSQAFGESERLRGIARDAGICSNLLEAAMEIGGFESQFCCPPCYLDLMATNLHVISSFS